MSKLAQSTLDAIAAAVASALVAAQAPAVSAPAKAAAKSPAFGDQTFAEYVAGRRAAALKCAIHPAAECNRTFSPKSSGNVSHEARLIK